MNDQRVRRETFLTHCNKYASPSFLALLLLFPQISNAAIILTSTRGTEDVSATATRIRIDTKGAPSATEDFKTSGSIENSVARNTSVAFTIDAISVADPKSGSKHRDGKIDRDSSGKLGVRGGSNGINEREGFLLGLDAANLNPRVGWQLTGIRFAYIGDGESYIIVNRNDPTRRLAGDTNDHDIHIIRMNCIFHGLDEAPLPERYILINHGHDGDCDCWDLEERTPSGEHPVVHISLEEAYNEHPARVRLTDIRYESFEDYMEAITLYSQQAWKIHARAN
ncbi:MAG: hypothetical protein CMO80_11880 [Verrucomicrobiales bacterium]|nr:hypothetical protein [Verrucomicrobiales bacterium]|tara:strand:+ start:2372 stop:3214 length:843 start_codon:yes stop_codon:yes gene_type:complete